MRKTLTLLLMFGLLTLNVHAADTTPDYLTISNLTVTPGNSGVYNFTVKMKNVSRSYTAINMDLHLPDGLTPQIKNDGKPRVAIDTSDDSMVLDEYGDNNHSIGATFDVVDKGVLRVVISSTANAEMQAIDGNLFKVYVKASPFLKPGTASIAVDEIAFIVKEGGKAYQPASQPDLTFNVNSQSTVSLNISADNQWSTAVVPFNAALPTGVQAYSCSSTSGDYLVLEAVTSLAAYQPYILHAESGYTGALSGSVDATQYVATATAGLLSGAIVSRSITEGYVLQNKGDGACFYNVNGQSFNIPEGRCWLTVPDGSRAAFGFDVETTAVDNINIALPRSYEVYDLEGRRVPSPQAGHLYIIGGRKVLKLK